MVLLRASRVMARAARSALSAASRRAAGARSGSAVAPDLLLRRSPVATLPFLRCLSSHTAGSVAGRVEFEVEDKDSESDEALWNLYERWCKAYGAERRREEMQRRFDYLKDSVLFLDRENKKAIKDGVQCNFELNMYADGKLWEQQACRIPLSVLYGQPYSETCIFGRAGPFISKREDLEEEDFPDPLA